MSELDDLKNVASNPPDVQTRTVSFRCDHGDAMRIAKTIHEAFLGSGATTIGTPAEQIEDIAELIERGP
jgi:hypothetical protein